jgi:HAD superfamily hydrolase (TIGR01549 family)
MLTTSAVTAVSSDPTRSNPRSATRGDRCSRRPHQGEIDTAAIRAENAHGGARSCARWCAGSITRRLYDAFSEPHIWRTYHDTIPTLEALLQRGTPMAVISNWDRRLPEILDRLSIAPFFDTLAVSSLEGVEKPAPDIFRRTVDRLGVASAHTLHIGDSPRDDYLGARGAGVTSVLLDRRHLFADKGYRRIERLDALFEVLESER